MRAVSKPVLVSLCLCLITAVACSDAEDGDSSTANNTSNTNNFDTPRSIQPDSETGCVIDADCISGNFCYQNHCSYECIDSSECANGECSDRGRCVEAGQTDGDGLVVEAAPSLRIVTPPETVLRAHETDQSVFLKFDVAGAAAGETITYRVARAKGGSENGRLGSAEIVDGKVSIEIEIGPEGRAALFGEDRDANPVAPITVFSSVGNFDLAIVPAPKLDGVWVGNLEIETIGGQELGIAISLIGETPDQMQAVLIVDGTSVFEPRDNHDPTRDYEVATLVKNDALNQYQAVFTHEYRFNDGVFASLPDRQLERTLRFDFDADAMAANRVQGRFSDSWRGLYDTQTQAGTEQVGVLAFIGEFDLQRIGDRTDEPRTPSMAPAASPRTLARGELGSCTSVDFTVPAVDIGPDTYSCAGVASLDEFRNADAVTRAECAIAYSASVQAGQTTDEQLALYFGAGPGTGAPSFEDFLAACGDDNNDDCTPSPDAVCAFELIAFAANDVTVPNLNNDTATADRLQSELMVQMSDSAHEAFLARQLGAFYADMTLRREWLRNSTAPGVFLDTVEAKNLELLQTWQTQVLDVHRDVFVEFFQRDALTQLGRATSGALSNEKRVRILSEAGVLWRGYSSALTLAADRWATIVRDQADRDAKLEYLQTRAVELYLTMGILIEYNRAAGAGFEGASLAQGFAQLTTSILRLSTPHTDAVFARDAQVVTATSLNPLSDNDSLLSERRNRALAIVQSSQTSIEAILDDVTTETLTLQAFETRLQTESREAANRIALLCGLPPECSPETLLADSSCVKVAAGECGLSDAANPETGVVFDPGRVAASKAGESVLSVLEAFETVAIEKQEVETLLSKLEIEREELAAFKRDIDSWDAQRAAVVAKLRENLEEREELRDDNVADIADKLLEISAARTQLASGAAIDAINWNLMTIGQIQTDYRSQITAGRIRAAGSAASLVADYFADGYRYAAMSLPTVVGTANDSFSKARTELIMKSERLAGIGQAAVAASDSAASYLERENALDRALREAEVQNLRDLQAVDQLAWQAEIDNLEDAISQSDRLSQNEIETLREAAQLAQEQLDVELAYARDYSEFRRRNAGFQKNLLDVSALLLKLARAEFRVSQRLGEYNTIVLEASLENAKLVELRAQLTDLNNLAGGVGAIFTKSYALDRAETELALAREALMDWLVVLEYYAVRPFIAQRVQILLARNAYQLRAIADKLELLERDCGGSERSKATQLLSLRDDVFGVTRGIKDGATGQELDRDERFRELLRQSYVPINRRVRYSTSETLGDVLERTDGVLAAPFPLKLDEFANLSLACNAKIESIGVQLVGDIGEGRPTVTILYDGVSQLRSCQPNVDEYVRAFGNGMSDYGSVSYLRTDGRAMSPLAGINDFIESAEGQNRTLAGLPVASEYTLLIDLESAANESFDFSKLEDVIIQVEYSYQDLFAESCD